MKISSASSTAGALRDRWKRSYTKRPAGVVGGSSLASDEAALWRVVRGRAPEMLGLVRNLARRAFGMASELHLQHPRSHCRKINIIHFGIAPTADDLVRLADGLTDGDDAEAFGGISALEFLDSIAPGDCVLIGDDPIGLVQYFTGRSYGNIDASILSKIWAAHTAPLC
jgi:hypothetical protein